MFQREAEDVRNAVALLRLTGRPERAKRKGTLTPFAVLKPRRRKAAKRARKARRARRANR